MKCKCCKRTIDRDFEDLNPTYQWLHDYSEDGLLNEDEWMTIWIDPLFKKIADKEICEDCFIDLCHEIMPNEDFSF